MNNPSCKTEGCFRLIAGGGQGYCKPCYDKAYRAGELEVKEISQRGSRIGRLCIYGGCAEPVKYKGLCGKHYKRQWRYGDPSTTLVNVEGGSCIVSSCERPRKMSNGYCAMHYNRMRRNGKLEIDRNSPGEGGINLGGYRVISINGKRVYEHIQRAEEALGKSLPPGAVVHHMNGNESDNFTPLNLIICPSQTYHLLLHRRQRAADFARAMGWNVAQFLENVK